MANKKVSAVPAGNVATTHTDIEWDARIDRLIGQLVYGQVDKAETNPHELVAAKLLLKLELAEHEGLETPREAK